MKRLLAFALLSVALVIGTGAQFPFSFWKKAAAPAATNIIADLWINFETTTYTSAGFKAIDHSSTYPGYASRGYGPVTLVDISGAQMAPKSTINSASDTGTLGGSFDNDTLTRMGLDANYYPTTQSIGYAFKVTTGLDSGTYAWIHGLTDGSVQNGIAGERVTNTAGVYTLTVEGVAPSLPVTIAAATWYWVTVKYVQSGTCSMNVYSMTTWAQVGSTVTCTGRSISPFYHIFGSLSSGYGQVYLDNVVIDFGYLSGTTPAFPLGP